MAKHGPVTPSLSEDELEALLASEVDPIDNAPAAIPGIAAMHVGTVVTEAERDRRFRHCAALLVRGIAVEEIIEFFGRRELPKEPGFRMSPNATRELIRRTLDQMAREDALTAPHAKRLAIRRIKKEIDDARRAGMHNAVAAHERNLIQIEGTAAPVKVEAEIRLTEAVRSVLLEEDPERLRELVAEGVASYEAERIRGRALVLPEAVPQRSAESAPGGTSSR